MGSDIYYGDFPHFSGIFHSGDHRTSDRQPDRSLSGAVSVSEMQKTGGSRSRLAVSDRGAGSDGHLDRKRYFNDPDDCTVCDDNSIYDVPLDKIDIWKNTYPAVDVEQELRKMVAWSHSNPTRRKTRRGVNRFINSWLAREQDRGGSRTPREKEQAQTDEEYYAPYREMYANMKTTTDGPFQ